MQYSDLSENEKALFDIIDRLFMGHTSVDQKSFVRVLALLINKYKFKKR